MARPNNTQVRPVKTGLQLQNQYTKRQYMPAPVTIVRGIVLTAYQGIQFYDVATDVGRYAATYLGVSRGELGAMESSGFMPGQQVLVAVAPGEPNFQAFIIGAATYPKNGNYNTPAGQLVYPQVAGYEYGAGMSGAAYAKYPRLRNFNSGLTDTVDGDWIQHNRLGGAMGVEAFRVFMQAGPAAGVFAYSDDDHLRIVGQRFERFTFGEEYDDRQKGPTINYIGRRVSYPADALTEKQPQKMDVGGGAYFGHHTFEGPIDASDPGAEITRPALLHEYRGADGTYMLTAAKSIILQKWVGLTMPAERRINPPPAPVPPATESVPLGPCAPCTLVADLPAQPDDTGLAYRAVAAGQLVASLVTPQVGPTGATRYVNDLINQAFYGFRQLPVKWNTSPVSTSTFGDNAAPPSFGNASIPDLSGAIADVITSAETNFSAITTSSAEAMPTGADRTYFVDAHMWKALPKSFALEVTPFGAVQRFKLGRSMISILEDGTIILEAAGGSQLALGGGNILMTAEHDIIAVAGRNRVDIAGRDAAYRADRHVDINATTGRLTAVAGNQATLVGGVDGQGGVLVQSLGQYAQTNEDSPSTTGGVIIKARQQVGITAGNVTIEAQANGWSALKPGAGLINLKASSQVAWQGGEGWGAFGSNAFFHFPGADVVLGATCIMPKLVATTGFLYKRLAFAGTSIGQYTQLLTLQKLGAKRVLDQATSAASPLKIEFKAKWLTSADRSIPNSAVFNIPQPDWQAQVLAQTSEQSVLRQAFMGENPMNGTQVFPGGGVDALAIPAYADTGGVLTVSFTYVPIRRHLLKGI